MKQAVHPYHRCCRIVPSYAKPKGGIRISRANTAHRYHCHNKIVTCKYKKLFRAETLPALGSKLFVHTRHPRMYFIHTLPTICSFLWHNCHSIQSLTAHNHFQYLQAPRYSQAHSFPINRGARLHSVLRNVRE